MRRGEVKRIYAIVRKDLIIELRSKEIISTTLLFSLLVLVIFNFTFEPGSQASRELAPGILWVAFSFAGILGLNRSFIYEKDQECLQGILLTPMDRGSLYLGKFFGNIIFLGIVELITLPLFALLFNMEIINVLPSLLLIIFLGTVGFSSVGTLFSAISINTRAREVMLPILLFPISVPVILSSVKATGAILRGSALSDISSWLKLLAGYDVIFSVLSYLVFEYVIEE